MNFTIKNFTITSLVVFAVMLGSLSPASAKLPPVNIGNNWKGCAKTNYMSFAGYALGARKQAGAHTKTKKNIKRRAKNMCKKKCGATKTAKGFKRLEKGGLEQCGKTNKYWCLKMSAPKRFAYECR